MEPIGKNLAPIVNEAARNLAVARQLVASDGTILCWNCVTIQKRTIEYDCQPATFPTLHCEACLERYRVKRQQEAKYTTRVVHGVTYEHPVESDHAYRWRTMVHNMKHEQRLDQEGGAKMLANAKAIPGVFEGDVKELEAAYVARFGHYEQRPNKSVRYRDQGAAE